MESWSPRISRSQVQTRSIQKVHPKFSSVWPLDPCPWGLARRGQCFSCPILDLKRPLRQVTTPWPMFPGSIRVAALLHLAAAAPAVPACKQLGSTLCMPRSAPSLACFATTRYQEQWLATTSLVQRGRGLYCRHQSRSPIPPPAPILEHLP